MFKKLFNKFKSRFLDNKIDESISILRSSNRSPKKPINSIGCIVDTNLDLDYSDLLDLATEIGLKEKDIKIISYSNSIYNDPFCKMRISDKSVNFCGNLRSADAEEFISSNYDILVNYFGENKILTLLSAKTNAKFRVGFDCSNENINDIIFTDIFDNFVKFKKQLIKYLSYII
tara:strand:- start:12022 stop:12543 length:522 start_codon:yes stop_codon:yes gene_type:complete